MLGKCVAVTMPATVPAILSSAPKVISGAAARAPLITRPIKNATSSPVTPEGKSLSRSLAAVVISLWKRVGERRLRSCSN